jgi:hypothetical protein
VFLLRCIKAEVPILPADYVPATSVVQHARIDLDLVEMEKLMTQGIGCIGSPCMGGRTPWDLAQRVYSQGGHSTKYTILQLNPPLPLAVSAGDHVTQSRVNDWTRTAVAMQAFPMGSDRIQVTYHSVWRPCFGGGTSEATVEGAYGVQYSPVSAHCLDSDTSIKVNNVDVGVPLKATHDFRSLEELATEAGSQHLAGEKYYEKFKSFHSADYAHQFMMHLLDPNVGTSITGGNGNGYEYGHGRRDLVKKVAIYMIVWMQVVHKLERAVVLCSPNGEHEPSLYEWDQAVAFYAGSLWNEAGGRLLYRVTEDTSREFGTCTSKGTSWANDRIFQKFHEGQRLLKQGMCNEIAAVKVHIIQHMSILIIQQTLKVVHALFVDDDLRRERIYAAFFRKIIRPLVHMCDPKVADGLSDFLELRGNHDSDSHEWNSQKDGLLYTSFAEFKVALESTYPCMGITCADVGGVLKVAAGCAADNVSDYEKGAEPCGIGLGMTNANANTNKDGNANANTNKDGGGQNDQGFIKNDQELAVAAIVVIALIVLCSIASSAMCYFWGFRQGRYADLEAQSATAVGGALPSSSAHQDVSANVIGTNRA